MNLNQNPKVLHFAAESLQILSILGIVLSFPGISVIAPWAGIASAAVTGVSTFIKTQIVGNVPPSAPSS